MDISGRIQSDIVLKKLDGVFGKKPFMQKIIYMNLLTELALVFKVHGLYLIPSSKMASCAPDLVLVQDIFSSKNNNKKTRQKFNDLRLNLEKNKYAMFGTCLKRHVLAAKALGNKDIDPSLLEMFLCLYSVYLAKWHLSNARDHPIFEIGNYCGNGNTEMLPLHNLYFKSSQEE